MNLFHVIIAVSLFTSSAFGAETSIKKYESGGEKLIISYKTGFLPLGIEFIGGVVETHSAGKKTECIFAYTIDGVLNGSLVVSYRSGYTGEQSDEKRTLYIPLDSGSYTLPIFRPEKTSMSTIITPVPGHGGTTFLQFLSVNGTTIKSDREQPPDPIETIRKAK